MPNMHIVDRYLQPLKKLGIINDNKGLNFFIDPKNEIDISTYLPSGFEKGFIGFVIGAKHFTKRLPNEKIIEICNLTKGPIVLLGGKEDEKNALEIMKKVGKNVFNSCGELNLQQSAWLIKSAARIITNDTGLMHIAAAFNKDIISVWGNTVPEFGMYPYYGSESVHGTSHVIEVKNLACRPCTKIGFQKCPKEHFDCMNKIQSKDIVNILEHS